MAAKRRVSKSGRWRIVGYFLAIAGGAIIALSMPGWLWLLMLGVLLVWAGLLVAMGPR